MNGENLWAPWRMAYLRELDRRAGELGSDDAAEHAKAGDFLRDFWLHPEHDERNHVVFRNAHGMILLNRYPYASGHLLIALGEARPTLLDYDEAQRRELWRLVEIAIALAQRTLNPQGINMGINEGRAAGAGVPEHLHAHVVPRWTGDTNFMSVVGQVRVTPEALEQVAAAYREKASGAKN